MMNSLSNNCMMIPHKPFVNNDICFISKLEDVPSFSFHIPSPFLHYEDEAVLFQDLQNHLELQQQQSLTAENTVADTLINMADSSTKDVANDGSKQGCRKECNSSSAAAAAAAEQIPRKKTCKKDRHSKINTAHGPRDRRMRLSLDVARKFFDLQDLLGFDKASKTVEWLLTKSRSAIKELSRGLPQMRSSCTVVGANSGASSTSECEVISGVDESAINENQQMLSKVKPSCTKEKKKIKAARRIPYHPLAKQSREKARERARERTKIRKLGEAKQHIAAIDHELNRLGSWSSSLDQTGDESGTKDYIKNPSSNNEMLIKEVEEISRHERQLAATAENLVHDSMVVGGNWSPSALFNFQLNAGVSTHGPHYMDLQFYCKSSEAYSNINLCG